MTATETLADRSYREPLSEILRPVSPPKVLAGEYTDDQHRRLVDVIKRNGPWPTIVSHHFTSVDELVATSSGVRPETSDLTLDDMTTAHFRGFLGQNSIAYFPELEDCYYNSDFLRTARDYWRAA